jgi:hypothetical protein
MQDASLDETASDLHHALPLIVFVGSIKGKNRDPKTPSSSIPSFSSKGNANTLSSINSPL